MSTEISDQIARAVEKLRAEVIPKAAVICNDAHDKAYLDKRLKELERLHQESLQPPVFSVRFLGDTQNGKSTLVNVLLGRKVLPEGHVGACSATIVRCRYAKQKNITIRFRYTSEEQFLTDLAEKSNDAELALSEDGSASDKREVVCNLLGRFLRLVQVDPSTISDPRELITTCRDLALQFEERKLLGTEEVVKVGPDTEKYIAENLSAKGRRAFVVDECLIEGNFPHWHPALELVDMPGTNAFNPWDDQVNVRLQQKVGGLAIVTKGTQLNDSVMEWFKESSILPDVAGSSERNQVRVFVIKTFVDQLNLNEENEEQSHWEQTQTYCKQIGEHLRTQIRDLVTQRFVEPNEVELLKDFVDRMPVHFVSPKIYRNLTDSVAVKKVKKEPLKHLSLAEAFQRFDRVPENTGIPRFQKDLFQKTEEFVTNHYLRKLQLDFGKEVGLVARFFRGQRVGIEQRLADQGAAIAEIDNQLQGQLEPLFKGGRDRSEGKIIDLKDHFETTVGKLLDRVSREFGSKVQRQLQDWMQLHWASLRCAGRKNGYHTTARGYEIDFNGQLADFCVEALNSSWISFRARLRKLLYDDLLVHFLPKVEQVVAQAKGQEAARIELIESTYGEVADSARGELELQLEKYDADVEEFDSLRPVLTQEIRQFMMPTYQGIASEMGSGSAARMRNHLNRGVHASTGVIRTMLKDVVRQNWEGLTGAVELRVPNRSRLYLCP